MKIRIERVTGNKVEFDENLKVLEEKQDNCGDYFYIVEGSLGEVVELCFSQFGDLIVRGNWYDDKKPMILIYDDYFE